MNRKGLQNRQKIGKRILSIWNACSFFKDEPTRKRIGIMGTTPKACSCWMCCNRRRSEKGHSKLTRKEQLQLIDLKEEF